MWVVPAFDELEHRDARFGLGLERHAVGQLAFQGREEALAQGVVIRVTDRAHRRPNSGLPAASAEGNRGVLAALVGMMNHVAGPALPQRHVQRREHQFGTQMIGHCPSDHTAAPGIQHHRQI
jgi:hypothetical protein